MTDKREAVFRDVPDAEAGVACGLRLDSVRFLLTRIRKDRNILDLWDCQLLSAVADCGATHSADSNRGKGYKVWDVYKRSRRAT